MIKSLIHSIKHPPAPVKRLIKWGLTRFGPLARSTARRSRLLVRTPVARSRLGLLLAGGGRLAFPRPVEPELAVVVVVEGRADLLLACLRALGSELTERVEVILVENGATGTSRRLLRRVEHATLIALDRRLDRAAAERLASGRAGTEFIAWLDADCRLLPGSLAAALAAIRSRPGIGAVGGKTIRRDEVVEEAGSILWQDGSTEAYGAGRDPDDPEVMFSRAVDFNAGGFLLARRAAVVADPAWAVDDGVQGDRIRRSVHLRASGLETVYDPRIVLARLGRSPAPASPLAADLGAELAGQLPKSAANILLARHRGTGRHRVLLFEYRVPHITLGAGYPRSNYMVEELVKLGYFVTFFPVDRLFRRERWADVYGSVDRSVEVMIDHAGADAGRFLAARAGYYDVILISRPSCMEAVRAFLPWDRVGGRPRIVYDAEAIYAFRTIEQRRHEGRELSPAESRELVAAEVQLVEGADAILAVSAGDARNFAAHGVQDVAILSHRVDPVPTPRRFEERSGFLFVGPVIAYGTPNADSIEWFATAIYPQIRARLGATVSFRTAGTNHATQLFPLEGNGVEFLGRVPDLTSVYDSARVFVAPTRFAAGIPLKCVEAAAHGVPIIATSLLVGQLGWQPEEEILVADTAEAFADQCVRLYEDADLWARIRAGALRRVEATYSTRAFAATLRQTVGPVATPVPAALGDPVGF